MHLRQLAGILFVGLLQVGCDEKKVALQEPKGDSTIIETQNFFPVTAFILGELARIEKLPVTPLKIVLNSGREDSTWMKREDVRTFAAPFLKPVIDTTNLKNLFRENSFLDQTINAFTFSYEPSAKVPDTLPLRRWDVYIDSRTNTVKRIYMVKEINIAGTRQTQQLTWNAGHWLKITTITEQKEKQPEVIEEKMIWDFNEE